jgi:hypothetical protein
VRRLAFALTLTACGAHARGPSREAAPSDPDLLALAHAWTIENHVVTPKSDLADADAAEWHGRKLAITAAGAIGYTTPFQGACKDASYTKRTRALVEVAADVDLADDERFVPVHFGLPAQVLEFDFLCNDRREGGRPALVPILTIYEGGNRAMTCFSGVCYLLARE